MNGPKMARKWAFLGYGEAPCVAEKLVSDIMEDDDYGKFSIHDVASCVCDIVKNAIKWGNGGVIEATFDLAVDLYDGRIEIEVTDRGTKSFNIRDKINEYPTDGTPEEILAYHEANQSIGRNGFALFVHSKVMEVLESYPVMDDGKQIGTRVHMVYRRK